MPPDTVAVAVPLQPPKQDTLVFVMETVNAVGCVIATVAVLIQPFASVRVSVYFPAHNPVQEEVLHPPGAHK